MPVTSKLFDMTPWSIFWRGFVSLVKFRYWSKFHVNITTGSRVMTISFYKWLTRNPGIPPSEFSPISGDRGESGIPNLTRKSVLKCYWMLQKAVKVTTFTVSKLLRKNLQGVKLLPPPPRLGLKKVKRVPQKSNLATRFFVFCKLLYVNWGSWIRKECFLNYNHWVPSVP